MMKKPIKVKGTDGRTSLIEFLVTKRVKYFEYLRDIHSDEGALWMNSVYFNRTALGRYFGVAADCLAALPPGVRADSQGETAGLVRIAFDMTKESYDSEPLRAGEGPAAPAAGASPAPTPAPPLSVSSTAAAAAAAAADAGDDGGDDAANFTYVSLDKLPNPVSTGRESRLADWQKRHLPALVGFSMALSDLLLVPVSGEEFVEGFYFLLLELEVAFAANVAARTLAQRSVKALRHSMSPALTAALRPVTGASAEAADPVGDAAGGPPSPTRGLSNQSSSNLGASAAHAEQSKTLFLAQPAVGFAVSTPSYDTVVPGTLSVLTFAYRRLCDYDLMCNEACVKRILSIDKRVEKLLLQRLGDELQTVAQLTLVREAYVLSPGGLFRDVCGTDDSADFVKDLIASQAVGTTKKSGRANDDDDDDDDETTATATTATGGAANDGGSGIDSDDAAD